MTLFLFLLTHSAWAIPSPTDFPATELVAACQIRLPKNLKEKTKSENVTAACKEIFENPERIDRATFSRDQWLTIATAMREDVYEPKMNPMLMNQRQKALENRIEFYRSGGYLLAPSPEAFVKATFGPALKAMNPVFKDVAHLLRKVYPPPPETW